jgi:hypothetical protein
MGTRADFYVGRGNKAEWIGSIAWDGYPSGITTRDDKPIILKAETEKQFREEVSAFFAEREDVSLPQDGWPWPWNDSCTSDYAYAFDGGKVYACPFGHGWFVASRKQPEDDAKLKGPVEFPDMKDRQKVIFGKRSGVIIVQG